MIRSNRLSRCRNLGLALALLAALVPGLVWGAGDPDPVTEIPELIVLLSPESETLEAEAVVQAFQNRRTLPESLKVGEPVEVRFALTHRAKRELRRKLLAQPEHPRARLERYVVFRYPDGTDLDAVLSRLRRVPGVLHVEKNLLFSLSVTPNDPLFPAPPISPPDPEGGQWGSRALNLEAAWDHVKGNAYVGLIDIGIQVDHPDLRAFPSFLEGPLGEVCEYASGSSFEGGNFRPQFSWDFTDTTNGQPAEDCNPDTRDPAAFSGNAGHGTHVAGIVAATTDNNLGVAGTCWHCSLMMTKASLRSSSIVLPLSTGADALTFLVDKGAQIVSMSWGLAGLDCAGAQNELGMMCQALTLADRRDVVMTAAPGNDKLPVEFPASDSRVISVGGIEASGAFWDRADDVGCPCDQPGAPGICITIPTWECGSNYTPGSVDTLENQDLVGPAKSVMSTLYEGFDWCQESGSLAGSGYGLCTGTSMSAPYIAGVAGLLRSVNPLLTKSEIRTALITNGDRTTWHPQFGWGLPDADAAVEDVFGTVGGQVLANRLTPLFTLYSPDAETHLSTSVPQMASAAIDDAETYYFPRPQSPPVGGYNDFPRICVVGPCPDPRASAYVFTSENAPAPGLPSLVPLYRMSFDKDFGGNPQNRSFFYTTEVVGIEFGKDIDYELDGIEGYIYPRCTPEPGCIPAGAERLYRLYHFNRDDYAIFPESELASYQADGYVGQPSLNDWIGYVYPNTDSDGDHVIDGFEGLIGTDPQDADSDCDGLSDGEEVIVYDGDGYGDPLDGSCNPDIVLSDTFTGNGSLNGRPVEVGGVNWIARPGAVLSGSRVLDSAAIGGVPISVTVGTSGVLTFQADVNPNVSDWVGTGFARSATQPYWGWGELWILVKPTGKYTAFAQGTSSVLGSGTIPGTATNGYHQVEIHYTPSTRLATFFLNGTQVVSQVLASAPDIQYAGFHMYVAAEGGARLDNFEVQVPTASTPMVITDAFSGGGPLNGRTAESGNAQWTARDAARVGGGRVQDSAAIAGVPFDPSTHPGERMLTLTADLDPFKSDWVGTGFASGPNQAYWSIGQLWVLVRPSGSYSVSANRTTVATGTIPGTATNGYHHAEIQYNTQTRLATILLNGVQVFSGTLASAPDIQYAGFHMHTAAEGGGKIDNFEVRSVALP
jgi:serine protease